MQTTPLTLPEAVLSLYASDPTGAAVGAKVWAGGVAENLRLPSSLEEVLLPATGDQYRRAYHVDESHEIVIDRLWLTPLRSGENFQLTRNAQYVLELLWRDPRATLWFKRTYYGVTARSQELSGGGLESSAGQFGQSQTFRAQRYLETSGVDAAVNFPTPAAGDPAAEQQAAFFYDGPLTTGTYLLGHYRWNGVFKANYAKALVLASQGAPTVLTLEIDGVLTSTTLTLSAAALGTESTAEVAIALNIPDLASVRWKVTSAPAAVEDCAVLAAVVMRGGF